jgi:hypothetical protein
MTKLADTNRTTLENILRFKGNWNENRYGNFDHTAGKYRVKFQDTSFRIESKVVHEVGPCSWIKIGGGYYKDTTFVDDCVLVSGRKIRKVFF